MNLIESIPARRARQPAQLSKDAGGLRTVIDAGTGEPGTSHRRGRRELAGGSVPAHNRADIPRRRQLASRTAAQLFRVGGNGNSRGAALLPDRQVTADLILA